MTEQDLVFTPSDFVAVFNQTIEYAYPSVALEGEIANFRVSKNRWVYFDLKDDLASLKFFGTVYSLPGPLEDGMTVRVRATPRLHPQFGFSLTFQSIAPKGQGSLKKAFDLLQAKLTAEGLFAPERKRPLPYPPLRIGLIASGESAAYHDFVKVLNERWGGMEIVHADVQVQGEAAPQQVVRAVEYFNSEAELVDVLVITRGGGSADDLAAFNDERLVRAIAASRIPTLVAIGHEVDVALAELAADTRASTPSNAAQLLTPHRAEDIALAYTRLERIEQSIMDMIEHERRTLHEAFSTCETRLQHFIATEQLLLEKTKGMLELLHPHRVLARGYALVYQAKNHIGSARTIKTGDELTIQLHDGTLGVAVNQVKYDK